MSSSNNIDSRLVPGYVFEEFVVGPHNRFPHAAAQAVADNLGKAYNPLFIYGPVGMGKTHLMQAVGHRVLERNNSAHVLYVTAEQFMMEVIELLQSGSLQTLREKYRSLDLLLVDDIQFLATSESTQEEFFHTFNELHHAGKQIIMTSDRPPKMLTTLEDRLRSRFEWGLIADIKQTNLETRVAILRKKENHMGNLNLGDDIRLYIAGKLKSNIRELEGILRRIQAYAQLNEQEITLEMVKDIMRELLPPQEWGEEEASGAPASVPAQETPAPPVPSPAPVLVPPAAASPAETKAEPLASVELTSFSDSLLNLGALDLSAPSSAGSPSSAPHPSPVPEPTPAPHEGNNVAKPLPPQDLPVQAFEAAPAPEAEPLEPGYKNIPVAFFFPMGKARELKIVRQKFKEVVRKHKLKFHLHPSLEVPYAWDDNLSYNSFLEKCVGANLMIAIVLGPPPESRLQVAVFQQKVQDVFDPHGLSLQLIPWDELNKDYRYLNLALDITLIRFKQKG